MKITRKKKVWLALVLCSVAGCSNDSAHTLSRDYRNMNNECIDAMMMVTSESRAKFAATKIFKPFPDRIGPLDQRTANFEQNTDDNVIVLQVVNTESVAILFAENSINQRRFKLEQDRIKNLVAFKIRTEEDKLKAEGQANPVVKAGDKWPNLNDFATGLATSTFKSHLDKGTALFALYKRFNTKPWQKALPKVGLWEPMNAAFLENVKKFDKLD
jgi:hypothetical protein